MAGLSRNFQVCILLLGVVCSCFRSVQNHPEEELERARVNTLSQDDRRTCDSKDQDCSDRVLEGSQSDGRLVRLEGFKVWQLKLQSV